MESSHRNAVLVFCLVLGGLAGLLFLQMVTFPPDVSESSTPAPATPPGSLGSHGSGGRYNTVATAEAPALRALAGIVLLPTGQPWADFTLGGASVLLTDNMAWVPGGWFKRGDRDFPDALPIRSLFVDGFWIDRTEVTNEQFARFVQATKYVTVAERMPDPRDYPGAPPEKLVKGSIVFTRPDEEVSLQEHLRWWQYVPGASWRHPEGPNSTLEGRGRHPVVHICWLDAVEYARWAGKRLPTEAEWERAARGGLESKRFGWGDELLPGGKWQANIWQGRFPRENLRADGYYSTAPVGSFPPNGFGVFDMAGNVWEWCADWYQPDYYSYSPERNPVGPRSSYDPNEPRIPKRVQRGGSFLCSDLYCVRYRPGARGKGAIDSGQSHAGFRCVRSAR